MALWGISTTTETQANNYALPKHLNEYDRTNTPWNCFADERGWVYRRYGSDEHSGLSKNYYDEVLVPVVGLNTNSGAANETGLGLATPVAVFFEDPNKSSIISLVGGGTSGISTGATGYVHLVFNELVWCSAGATMHLQLSGGTSIVATAGSFGVGAVYNHINGVGLRESVNYNGQITNRVAFAFTAPGTAAGQRLTIDIGRGFIGVITDVSGALGVTSTLTADLLRNIGGGGTTGNSGVGIGTTVLSIVA
jgi:hypothetical protein